MIGRQILLFLGISLGVILAFFATVLLGDNILPIACLLLIAIIVGFFVWIVRGGLKTSNEYDPGKHDPEEND
jgi:galactitol-specific phosphotransferase system IIC component